MVEMECHSPELTAVQPTSPLTEPTSTTTSVLTPNFQEAETLFLSMPSRNSRSLFHLMMSVRPTSSEVVSMLLPSQVQTPSRVQLTSITATRTCVVTQLTEPRFQAHARKTEPQLTALPSAVLSSRTSCSSLSMPSCRRFLL